MPCLGWIGLGGAVIAGAVDYRSQRSLGLEVLPMLLARAEEVIEVRQAAGAIQPVEDRPK